MAERPIAPGAIDGIANGTYFRDDTGDYTQLEIAIANSSFVLSAWAGPRLVGLVRVISDGVYRSIIYDLVVHPDFQRRGIGSELFSRCLQRFSNTQITLGTASKNFAFYQRFGFALSHNYLERRSATL